MIIVFCCRPKLGNSGLEMHQCRLQHCRRRRSITGYLKCTKSVPNFNGIEAARKFLWWEVKAVLSRTLFLTPTCQCLQCRQAIRTLELRRASRYVSTRVESGEHLTFLQRLDCSSRRKNGKSRPSSVRMWLALPIWAELVPRLLQKIYCQPRVSHFSNCCVSLHVLKTAQFNVLQC